MPKNMRVPDEMLEILKELRDSVKYHTWQAIEIKDIDLFRILAKKIRDTGTLKKT